MSLGFILLIVLIIILIGGVGPGFYAGSPWPYGEARATTASGSSPASS